jgi:isopropylmalate/homocitrate/citramalate synthase
MARSEFDLTDVTMAHVSLGSVPAEAHTAALELAHSLRDVGVSTVDVGTLNDPAQFNLAHSLALTARGISIMAHSTMNRVEITHVFEALKACGRPRLGLRIPTAPEVVRGIRRITYTELIQLAESYIVSSARLGLEVDAVIEQAATTEPVFIARLARIAVDAGALGITLVESGGLTQEAFASLTRQVVRAVPGTRVGVRCANYGGMGASLAYAALEQGAAEVGTVVTEWSDHLPCPSLERLAALGLLQGSSLQMARLASMAQGLLLPAARARTEAAASDM